MDVMLSADANVAQLATCSSLDPHPSVIESQGHIRCMQDFNEITEARKLNRRCDKMHI